MKQGLFFLYMVLPFLCFGQPLKGHIIYASKSDDGTRHIYMVDADGSNDHLLVKGDLPEVSRNGEYLTYIVSKQNGSTGSLYMLNLKSLVSKRIFKDDNCSNPQWSPDGKQIAFEYYGQGTGTGEICIIDANGKHLRKLLKGVRNPAWSPDGRYIAFAKKTLPSNGYDLYTINLKNDAIKRITATADIDEKLPLWSPDGKYLGYRGDKQGENFNTIETLEIKNGKVNVVTKCICDHFDWTPDDDIIYANDKGNKSNAQIAIINPKTKATHNITHTPKDHYWPEWVGF